MPRSIYPNRNHNHTHIPVFNCTRDSLSASLLAGQLLAIVCHSRVLAGKQSGAVVCQQTGLVRWQEGDTWRDSLCLSSVRCLVLWTPTWICEDYAVAPGETPRQAAQWRCRGHILADGQRLHPIYLELSVPHHLPADPAGKGAPLSHRRLQSQQGAELHLQHAAAHLPKGARCPPVPDHGSPGLPLHRQDAGERALPGGTRGGDRQRVDRPDLPAHATGARHNERGFRP
ncbi:uncharacterized protein [Drosophila suzukii]|uniref:Uncharacterized protein isoform X5 n=1 Tax=Drosophila suzukii TaxID=28584 RepID=A0AB39ZZX0_DROSZ